MDNNHMENNNNYINQINIDINNIYNIINNNNINDNNNNLLVHLNNINHQIKVKDTLKFLTENSKIFRENINTKIQTEKTPNS